jgi:hypothetical protein
MKFLLVSLTMLASSWAFAGGGQDQGQDQGQGKIGMDNETLWVYTAKKTTHLPAVVVMRVSKKDGLRGVYHSDRMLPGEPLAGEIVYDDLEYSDGVEWVEAPSIANTLSPLLDGGFYDWHHNRRSGYGYYHTYGWDHPYRSWYSRHYDPVPGVRYRYPRYYYRYEPYYYNDGIDLVYRFFRRILD